MSAGDGTSFAENAEAERWLGFARAIARRFGRPPLYSTEDWYAEAYLGLAKALAKVDRSRPAATHSRYIERVVENHLKRAIRNVLSAPKSHVWLQRYRRDEDGDGTPNPPRVTYARARSMDATLTEDGESLVRHEVVPNPMSPDPAEALDQTILLGALRSFADGLVPRHREALGFLLRGLSPREVAELTGDTEGAVSNVRLRVRQKLAATLEPLGYA